MAVYFNEFDPFAAQWLRELIKAGHIAQGDVDDRSILDVSADDLRGYDQCHFFAGIGVWSYSLRRSGWSDDRPVWTGSCPCQPLSVAGLGHGHADSRHLWPAFHRLIAECRPAIVLGEQVAGADGREWFSAVRADLEADGYACGGADLSAAGVGAPHIRQRLYWLAHAAGGGREPRPGIDGVQAGEVRNDALPEPRADGSAERLAHAGGLGREVALFDSGRLGSPGGERQADVAGGGGASSRLAHAGASDGSGGGQAARVGGPHSQQLNDHVMLAAWPTPTTRDWKDGGNPDINVPENSLLGRVAWQAGWNTPRATDGSNGGPNQANGALSADVSLAGWPTPMVPSGGRSVSTDKMDATGRTADGRKHTASLEHAVKFANGPARITAGGQMLTGSSAAMESGGQLNPAHSRWLMGLPPAWDDCAVTAMLSMPKRRKPSSKA